MSPNRCLCPLGSGVMSSSVRQLSAWLLELDCCLFGLSVALAETSNQREKGRCDLLQVSGCACRPGLVLVFFLISELREDGEGAMAAWSGRLQERPYPELDPRGINPWWLLSKNKSISRETRISFSKSQFPLRKTCFDQKLTPSSLLCGLARSRR